MKPQTGHDVVNALLFAAHRVRNAADARLRERGLSLQGYKLMRVLENSDSSMREISWRSNRKDEGTTPDASPE